LVVIRQHIVKAKAKHCSDVTGLLIKRFNPKRGSGDLSECFLDVSVLRWPRRCDHNVEPINAGTYFEGFSAYPA
jgi:hypothetical protein